jgi:hypothetical protein
MSKTIKTQTKTASLINSKSFFDNNVFTKAVFDREIIALIEKGMKNSAPNPLLACENIANLFTGNIKEASVDLFSKIRNGLFYLIMMMDYSTEDPRMMFTVQSTATHLNDFYCEGLDKAMEEHCDLVRLELDKIETFQSSRDCAAPNILKENFIEMCKNKQIQKWAKSQLINVEFQKPDDFDEEAEASFLEQMQLSADDLEKMMDMDPEELTKILNSKMNK